MAAIIFLMNTLTGCSLKNDNMEAEAIYREFPEGELLNNGMNGSSPTYICWRASIVFIVFIASIFLFPIRRECVIMN